jgi:RNA polymerase sigma-70 factor (sigma-E family)
MRHGEGTPTVVAGSQADPGDAVAAAGVMTFEALVADAGKSLMRLAYALTGSAADAEDLWQETFAEVYRKWRRVEASDQPRAYVRRMLLNRHTSSRRRRWTGESPTDPHVLTAVAADATDRLGAQDALWRLLATLPPRTRAVLVLRYFEDLDDSSIADTLGITRSTVAATASRGLAQLRKREVVR